MVTPEKQNPSFLDSNLLSAKYKMVFLKAGKLLHETVAHKPACRKGWGA